MAIAWAEAITRFSVSNGINCCSWDGKQIPSLMRTWLIVCVGSDHSEGIREWSISPKLQGPNFHFCKGKSHTPSGFVAFIVMVQVNTPLTNSSMVLPWANNQGLSLLRLL